MIGARRSYPGLWLSISAPGKARAVPNWRSFLVSAIQHATAEGVMNSANFTIVPAETLPTIGKIYFAMTNHKNLVVRFRKVLNVIE